MTGGTLDEILLVVGLLVQRFQLLLLGLVEFKLQLHAQLVGHQLHRGEIDHAVDVGDDAQNHQLLDDFLRRLAYLLA